MDSARKTVLVVDNAESFVKFLEIVLARLNYGVIRSSTVTEALGLTCLSFPDLVISEVNLPDGSGMDLLRSIRTGSPARATPFVFLSTTDSSTLRAEAAESGAQAFLTKPLNVRALYLAMEDHLERRRRRYIRLPLSLRVKLSLAGERKGTISAQTQSFGEKGMFIRSFSPDPIGSRLNLSVYLPGEEEPYRVEGEVIHSILPPVRAGSPGMGIRFLDMEPEVSRAFSDFMLAHLTGTPRPFFPAPERIVAPAPAC